MTLGAAYSQLPQNKSFCAWLRLLALWVASLRHLFSGLRVGVRPLHFVWEFFEVRR